MTREIVGLTGDGVGHNFGLVHHEKNPLVPRGMFVATKALTVVGLGPLATIPDDLPEGCMVSLNPSDYDRIVATLKKIAKPIARMA